MNSTRTVITRNMQVRRDSQEHTYMCSRTIFVSRFLRFWWKFSGKRARIASAEDRSRNATSLVKQCRARSSCRRKRAPRSCRAEAGGYRHTQRGRGAAQYTRPWAQHHSHMRGLSQVWGLCRRR